MEKKRPILSISMLVSNNRRDTIEKCMESLVPLREAVPSELIIVDTGCKDEGIEIARRYTDKVVSFTDTIIIFTTNAGRQLYEDSTSLDLSGIPKKVIMQALETDKRPGTDVPFFPAAICSRMAAGNVVMFNHLGAHHLHAIACREIQRNAAGLEKQTDLQVHVD